MTAAAAAGFRIRRVKTSASLGDRLKRQRTRKKLSISQVEEETTIRGKFLLALEADSWDQIPSEVYAKGYLERYATYLGLPADEMLASYERARASYWRAGADDSVLAPQRLSASWFLVTPKLILWVVASGVVVLAAAVIGNQVSRYASAPYLELFEPNQARAVGVSQLELSARNFELQGKTAVGATVEVNGKTVAVNEDGSFSVSLSLQPGVNPVVVTATSPSGVVTTETRSVVVK